MFVGINFAGQHGRRGRDNGAGGMSTRGNGFNPAYNGTWGTPRNTFLVV